MTSQTMTVISGVVLLVVLALIGWRARRRAHRGESKPRGSNHRQAP